MILTLQDITHSFGGNNILKNCSFEFNSGNIYGISGPNGSGKTTLLNIINGLIRQTNGYIIIDSNLDITKYPIYKRNMVGILRISQHPKIFRNLTLVENLLIARKDLGENPLNYLLNYSKIKRIAYSNRKDASKILSELGLINKKEHLAKNLSLGEQKLTSFGTILMDKRLFSGNIILLLDEPFSGLNSKMVKYTSEVIKWIASKGNIILLTEHNEEILNDLSHVKLNLINHKLKIIDNA